MATNGIRQWLQKGCGLADPIRQCGTVNIDPITFEDAALAVEGR